MTLRQLLASVPFDDIVPYIMPGEHPDDVCSYRQAYDILLHAEADEGGCRKVYVSKAKGSDGTEYIEATHVEGQYWSTYIDGDVVVEDGINVSEAELAYKLLWHLTFFGFSQEETHENLSSPLRLSHSDNVYGRKAQAIDYKRYMLWANKAIRKRILESIAWYEKQGEHSFGLNDEDWGYIQKRETHCNRMKRMRDHRLEQRHNHLVNLEHCEDTVQELLSGQDKVTRADLQFLWNKNGRLGCEFQTRAYDAGIRLAYLEQLITKYQAMTPVKTLTQVAVKVTTSSKHPLSKEELELIKRQTTAQTGCADPIYIICIGETLDQEIRIIMVGPKQNKYGTER